VPQHPQNFPGVHAERFCWKIRQQKKLCVPSFVSNQGTATFDFLIPFENNAT
jgi:hypothetical protein